MSLIWSLKFGSPEKQVREKKTVFSSVFLTEEEVEMTIYWIFLIVHHLVK